jgi:mono/diheme cytochrome c family protein
MVFALATGNKIAIAVMGGIFIAFALVSAFVLPRRNPNFPNQNVGWYVFVSFLLFLAMIGSILVFGVEEEEGEAAGGESHPAETAPQPGTTGAQTETEGATTGADTETNGGAPAGDAAAGKAVFATAGCGSCHTLEAAGSTGNVGPNLDQAKPDQELIRDRVTNGAGPMPSFKGQLSDKQIDDVIAYVYSSTHG